MSYIKDYIEKTNKSRVALVGANSQGKTYQLEQLSKELKGKIIFVESETKSDENMKNSSEGTTLIEWITYLIGIEKLNNTIDEIISDLNITSSNDRVNVSLKNSSKTYKGLIEFAVSSNNNSKNLAGSGEKVLGQLMMINNILTENNNNNKYEYLIVDEPEAHLHPSLYALISKTLKSISNIGIKVVIATHSYEILKYFVEDTNEIIRMENLEPKVLNDSEYYYNLKDKYTIYTDDNLYMDSYRRIKSKDKLYFNKIMLNQLFKSIFSNVVLIGEGIAEEEIFDMFINEYTENYYNYNVSYIIAHGKELMTWYSAILKEIGIKTICLYDQDNEDSLKHKEINDTIKAISSDYIDFYVSGKGYKDNKIENYLNINTEDSDKGKFIISELRNLYVNNNNTLFEVLDKINDKIKSLCEIK